METDRVTLEALAAEVAGLRREARVVRRGGAAALVVAASVAALGFARAEPRIVEANRFVLLDESGKERAFLGTEEGAPRLAFRDSEGRERLRAAIDSGDHGVVTMLNSEGRPSTTLAQDSGRVGTLWLLDSDGATRGVLGSYPNGSFGLFLKDKPGRNRGHFSIDRDGEAHLDLNDAKEKNRVCLSVLRRGSAGMTIRDADENARIGVVSDKDDLPHVVLLSADGTQRAVLSQKEDGVGLEIRDPAGKLITSMGTKDQIAAGFNVFDPATGKPQITLGARKGGIVNLALSGGEVRPFVELGTMPSAAPGGKRATFINLCNPGGKPRVRLEAVEGVDEAPALSIHDAAGNVVHKVP